MKSVRISAIVFLQLGVSVASAQHDPMTISYVEGNVYVDAQRVQMSESGIPVKLGSVVSTEKGRVQLLFDRGDKMFLGENSSLRVSTSGPPEILSGSAVVITGELGPSVGCQGTVYLSDAGIFRFDMHKVLGENSCKLRVYKGAAGAQMPSFVWMLTPGKMIHLGSCGDFTARDEFKIENTDDLDRWSRERSDTEVRP